MIIEPLKRINVETWVLLAGALLFVVIIITAMIPDDHHGRSSSLDPASLGMQRGAAVNGPMPQRALPQNQMVAQLQAAQINRTYQYSGVIDQVVNRDPGGWGQLHIAVNDGAGFTQEVSLAPEWYLQFQGCRVQRGQQVAGDGFHFDGVNQGGVLYAKNVVVNGVRCRLRSMQGLALWTDQLR